MKVITAIYWFQKVTKLGHKIEQKPGLYQTTSQDKNQGSLSQVKTKVEFSVYFLRSS